MLKCRIILTTRSNSKIELPGVAELKVKELSPSERLRVFEKYYGKLSEDQKNIYHNSLDAPLGGNTQAIVMAAKMLKEQGISLENYSVNETEYLKTNSFSYEFHGEEVFDTVANNLSKFFQISQFLENASVEREILALMSCIMQIGIAERFLKTEFNLSNSNELIRLNRMGLINRINVDGSDFIVFMHPLIAKALNLNGIEPTSRIKEKVGKYFGKILSDSNSWLMQHVIKGPLSTIEDVRKMAIRLRSEHPASSDSTSSKERSHTTSSTNKIGGG